MAAMSMPPPPPPDLPEQSTHQTTEVPITEARALFDSFTRFLTVSVHTILYYRDIYPRQTFLSARAFNLPVHQSRHPKVCTWINDAVDAVVTQIAKGSVERVAVVIHSPPDSSPSTHPSVQQLAPGTVLERWMFDVSRFPSWPGGIEAMRNLRHDGGDEHREDEDENASGDDNNAEAAMEGVPAEHDPTAAINWADVDEHFRGAVRRLAYAGEKLEPLPQACTFTVVVELRDEAHAPIGHPQPWIPTQSPDGRPLASYPTKKPTINNTNTTTPIRSVEAGPLFFECWVEESKAKGAMQASLNQSPNSSV